MASVCFYFQVHQPYRLRRYRVFDIGKNHQYWNDSSPTNLNNERILQKVAEKCYLPANRLMLGLLERHPEFRLSYSLSGVLLEQLEQFSPETLRSFKALAQTGRVEFLGETYFHSLSFLYSPEEFARQVALHKESIEHHFKMTPRVFRNTELIYSNDVAKAAYHLGYEGILAEGADHILGWRSPAFLYHPPGLPEMPILLKNYKLSDDIAFRFGSRDWSEFPLTAPRFASWVSAINGNGELVNLFMDYETFGEHQWEDTGIFEFLRALPESVLSHPDNDFVTVSEAISRYKPVAPLDVPHFVSWADTERDLSAWRSNEIQHDALSRLYALRDRAVASGDEALLNDWRRLSTSDHFYYMCTKWWNDGDVHKYFSPYESPYQAFIAFSNVLKDLEGRMPPIAL
jgi:alpha-amylase